MRSFSPTAPVVFLAALASVVAESLPPAVPGPAAGPAPAAPNAAPEPFAPGAPTPVDPFAPAAIDPFAVAPTPAAPDPWIPAPVYPDAYADEPLELWNPDTPSAAPESEALAAPIATAPDGYDTIPNPFVEPPGFLEGFGYGLNASLVYDSNASGNLGRTLGGSRDDLILTVGASTSYAGGNRTWTYGASFGLNYAAYFNNTERSGPGYNLALNTGFGRGRIKFTGTFGTSLNRGNNRNFNNADVETLNFNTSLGVDYEHSAKTDISSRFGYRWQEPLSGGGAFNNTRSGNFDASLLWRYSTLTRVGPGVAYTFSTGQGQGERRTIAPIVRVEYSLARKIALDGTFGVQFPLSDGGGADDPAFTTNLGINYQGSPLWSASLSVYKGIDPYGGTGGGFRDTFNLRAAYNRQIRRLSTSIGVGYNVNSTAGGNAAGASGADADYFDFNVSAGTAILKDRVNASIFYSLQRQNGGGINNRDGFRVGLSLSSSF